MSEAKKIKLNSSGMEHHNRNRKMGKRNYYAKANEHGKGDGMRDRCMKPGHRGFLVTCNGHVRDCVRDSYRILNAYADELYGAMDKSTLRDEEQQSEVASDEEDISIKLQKEAEAAGKQQHNKSFRFQSVESGALNCLFIQTSLPDPNELTYKLMKELNDTKQHKSRFILRMLPILTVCRANLKDIIDAVGKLSDQYFLKEPKTFAILFNRRLNNDLSRDDVIRELAELIAAKNSGNKANLKNPDLAVIVEVIKGLCCIGILPEYYQLRKYNLVELVAPQNQNSAPASQEPAVAKTDELAPERDQKNAPVDKQDESLEKSTTLPASVE